MSIDLNKVHLMDCMDGMKLLDSESAQMVIADPPYNIGKDFGNNSDKQEMSKYLSDCDMWISEFLRILKPNGTLFIYGFSEILAEIFVRIKANKRWLVWHYTNKNSATAGFWQRSHESIICVWKNEYVFNEDLVREPYTEGFLSGSNGRVRPATVGRFSKKGKVTVYKAHENGALPRDVIKVPALAGANGSSERWFYCHTCSFVDLELDKHKDHNVEKHPTQKPIEICERLILSCKQDDGIVVVPFAGSGSECVAARNCGLKYVGFELNPVYVGICNHRLQFEGVAATPQKAIDKEEQNVTIFD